MEKFLTELTLKQKIRFGFGAIWVVLAIITIQAAVNLYIVRVDIKEVVELKQPVALDANQIMLSLEKGKTQLTTYILTADPKFLANYNKEYQNIATILNSIGTKLTPNQLLEIEESIIAFKKIPAIVSKIEETSGNRLLNFPAFKFYDDEMFAKEKSIQQQISLMIETELTGLSADRAEIISLLLNLQDSWSNVQRGVRGYISLRTDESFSKANNYLNQVEETLLKLETIEKEGLEVVLDTYTAYRENFMTLRQIHQGPKWKMDVWLMKTEFNPLYYKVKEDIKTISDQAILDMVETSTQVAETSLKNLILLLILSTLGQIIGMMVSRKVTKSVTESVDKIVQAMQAIAHGEGDLTQRLTVNGKDELAELARLFNIFIEKIQKTLRQVTETVHELEKSSKYLMTVTHVTKEGVAQQMNVAQELNNSMQMMAQKSKSVEDHSNNTTSATKQAVSNVKEGGEVVAGASETIQQVSDDMQKITTAVMQLNNDSQTISSVINVIREIADQTNLLALNAAIEAARAGEHGRGFAVVADEVRNLAQRTQESTLQIEQVIDKIRSATDETVKVVDRGQITTQAGYDAVMKAQQVLNPVVIIIDDINNMNKEMLAAAQSQNTLVQDVNAHINEIHDISSQAVEGTENTENSANDLQKIANKLENLVHQFKI
ncbi:MAG TPA: methyl-accepting chemotaxis protein [Thiomicrospira sp.]|nr:methyl-accepting chemotaxis protein [Thiomicrospira sp.]